MRRPSGPLAHTMITKISVLTAMPGEIYQLLCFTSRRIIVAETGRFIPIQNWKLSDLFWTKSDRRLRELNAPYRDEFDNQSNLIRSVLFDKLTVS